MNRNQSRFCAERGPVRQVHDLKCCLPHWEDINDGRKTVEIRWDDRGYRVGDVLILREWEPYENTPGDGIQWRYTGRSCQRVVTHVLAGGRFGLAAGYVALSIRDFQEEVIR